MVCMSMGGSKGRIWQIWTSCYVFTVNSITHADAVKKARRESRQSVFSAFSALLYLSVLGPAEVTRVTPTSLRRVWMLENMSLNCHNFSRLLEDCLVGTLPLFHSLDPFCIKDHGTWEIIRPRSLDQTIFSSMIAGLCCVIFASLSHNALVPSIAMDGTSCLGKECCSLLL